MIVFIHGSDREFIELEIKKKRKVLKNEHLRPILFNGVDLSFSVSEIAKEAWTPSMFDERKLLIVQNLSGLNTTKVLNDADFKIMSDLLTKPLHDVDIIFTLEGNKPDGKRKLVKLFKKQTEYISKEGLDANDLISVLNHSISKHKLDLDNQAKNLLIRYCRDLTDVKMAIDKLKLIDTKITEEIVKDLVVDQTYSMIYELSEALLQRNNTKVFNIYHNLIEHKFEPIQLMVHLANKYRQYYQLFILSDNGYSPNEISSLLKMSDRQAYFILNNHRHLITPYQCLSHLHQLAKLDQEAKSGKIDFKNGLELFMIKVLA